MLTLEPLGMPEVLPAFLVGYRVPPDRIDRVAAVQTPPWLLKIDQQAGGACMSYPTAAGVLLRLEANLDHAGRDAPEVIGGLRAMAEDPDWAILKKDFPTLVDLTFTNGDEYTPPQHQALHSFVSRAFAVPPFISGIEAFVRCKECNPLAIFANWRVFSCQLRPESRDQFADPPIVDDYVLHTQAHCFELEDTHLFDFKMMDALVSRVGAPLEIKEPPSVFLLWENSD